jgi:hypothetical protein
MGNISGPLKPKRLVSGAAARDFATRPATAAQTTPQRAPRRNQVIVFKRGLKCHPIRRLERRLYEGTEKGRAASSSRFRPNLVGAFRRNAHVCAGADASTRRPYPSLMQPWEKGGGRQRARCWRPNSMPQSSRREGFRLSQKGQRLGRGFFRVASLSR